MFETLKAIFKHVTFAKSNFKKALRHCVPSAAGVGIRSISEPLMRKYFWQSV
jgi:hypothetical protein